MTHAKLDPNVSRGAYVAFETERNGETHIIGSFHSWNAALPRKGEEFSISERQDNVPAWADGANSKGRVKNVEWSMMQDSIHVFIQIEYPNANGVYETDQ